MASSNQRKCIKGYWGRSTWGRVESERVPDKIRQRLTEKLLARGVPAWLYLPVDAGSVGVSLCTCRKDTNQVSDRPCNECYGVGLVPGYRRFLHETVHFGASESASYTLVDCTRDLRVKPNRVLMDPGATTCTITTGDKSYSNPAGDTWTVQLDAFVRDLGNTVTAEFSTDFGGTWTDIADINGVNQPVAAGVIRFRVTMTRTLAVDKSPAFEILRARHVRSTDYNGSGITDLRGGVSAGQILVLRPWVVEQAQSDTGRGVTVEWLGDRSWTMPLDYFDTSVTIDTNAARIDDRRAGPHPFYEYADGIRAGDRVVVTSIKWNESFGTFSHQSFDERRAQPDEDPYALVY